MFRRLTFLIFFFLTSYLCVKAEGSEGWIPVKSGRLIDHDMENLAVEIKTNSSSGSDEYLWLIFRNAQNEYAGGFAIKFSNTPKYQFLWCGYWTDFPTTPPTATYKIWKITLDRGSDTRVFVQCNEELVLNVLLSDQVCTSYIYRSSWSSYWSRIVTKIYFHGRQDTASNYYRPDQGWTPVTSNLKIDYDLDTAPLEVKTISSVGSNEIIEVATYSHMYHGTVLQGSIDIKFSDPPEYRLYRCDGTWKRFPTTPPTSTKKVWRFTLDRSTGVRVKIHCNGVLVLNYLVYDNTCADTTSCTDWWRKSVDEVWFSYSDIPSDYYRPYRGWNPMSFRTNVYYDLEKVPLEIKTNNNWAADDHEELNVRFYRYSQIGYQPAGGVAITVSSTPRYLIYKCSYWADLQTTLPTAAENIWRITKDRSSGIRLLIHCNGELVLDFQLSDQTCTNREFRNGIWNTYWSKDVTALEFYQSRSTDCSYRPHKVDGGWSDFDNWSSCSYECGGGEQSRSRECSKPIPQGGGANCDGEKSERRTCNNQQCTDWIEVGNYARRRVDHDLENVPVEIKQGSDYRMSLYFENVQGYDAGGILISWYRSSPQFYLRHCSHDDSNFPRTLPSSTEKIWRFTLERSSSTSVRLKIHCNGWLVLNFLLSDQTCSRDYWSGYWSRTVSSIRFDDRYSYRGNTHYYRSYTMDGGWSGFGHWSECSVQCGGGTQTRTRECSNPAPRGGGADCVGDYAQTVVCNTQLCPGDESGIGKSEYTFQTGQATQLICGTIYKVNTINGTIKGPAIHVKSGSILAVNVINGLTVGDIGLSIHWHGFNMKKAEVFDGVVGLTQCPIALNDSFWYTWTVTEQPGTYWYHTHDRKQFPGDQIDFIKGPLIVHEPDTPIGEFTRQDSYQIGNDIILFYNMIDGELGVGVVNGEEHPLIQVENGEYRFRIINGGSGSTTYFFGIDGYRLTVVATDGYSVEPYEIDMIHIGTAERYDVKINFNINSLTEDVCIRAINRERTEKGLFATLRIRKWGSLVIDETTADIKHACNSIPSLTDKRILNCHNSNPRCYSVTELTSTLKRNLYRSNFHYHTIKILKHTGLDWKVAIDGKKFTKNEIPCRAAIKRSSNNELPKNTNVLNLPDEASVTIVLLSNTTHQHPMHSHGHHFEVLEIYAPTNASAGCPFPHVNTAFSEPIVQLMRRPKQGVLKDTVLLPPCGAVAVRLNSDNRGVWFFHCHIDWHAHHGLAWLLNENNYLFSRAQFPSDYPSCHICEQ